MFMGTWLTEDESKRHVSLLILSGLAVVSMKQKEDNSLFVSGSYTGRKSTLPFNVWKGKSITFCKNT